MLSVQDIICWKGAFCYHTQMCEILIQIQCSASSLFHADLCLALYHLYLDVMALTFSLLEQMDRYLQIISHFRQAQPSFCSQHPLLLVMQVLNAFSTPNLLYFLCFPMYCYLYFFLIGICLPKLIKEKRKKNGQNLEATFTQHSLVSPCIIYIYDHQHLIRYLFEVALQCLCCLSIICLR